MKQPSEYQGPLAGLNVIDFGHYYAGPMAALLLADQGANVIRIMKPGEPELREQQFRLLNRNKKLLELDLQTEEGKAQALSLIERADVVIENFRPGVMKRLGLDYGNVKETKPGLVYLSLPGFASTDKERAQIQAWEGVVGAAAGLYAEIHLFRQLLGYPPVYTWVPHCSAYGAMHGAMAVMAALISREAHGQGTVIETPLVDAGLSGFTTGFAQGNFVIGVITGCLRTTRNPNDELPEFLKPLVFSSDDNQAVQLEKLGKAHQAFFSAPLGRYYPCSDGRLLLMWTHVKYHMIPVLKALGIYSQLLKEGFVSGSLWEPGEHNLIAGLSSDRAARLTQLVGDVLLTKTAEEWETLLAEYGPVVMARTRDEWLALESMMESGVFTQMNNGESKLTVPGRVVDMSGPPVGGVGALMEGFKEVETIPFEQAAALLGKRQHSSPSKLPELRKGDLLGGLKVLDMSSVLSGPTAGFTLAQYGAQVIKADQPDYLYFTKTALDVSQGKRSILNDIKTAEGREIFQRLVTWADVVIHNCLDDVARRLGISHEQLQVINPKIVSCQVSAFGGTWRGHWEGRPGFDPVACAASSLTTHYGTKENPQSHGSTSCGDIMGGLSLAYSALLGVYQQRKTGYGGEGRTSLVRANTYIQLPYMIAENGNSDWSDDHGQFALGDHWWQRLYQCRDGWIYVGSHKGCANLLVETVTGQHVADKQIVDKQTLEDAFLKRDCAHWAEVLLRVDIGCHRVLNLGDICAEGVCQVSNEASDETVDGALDVLCWEEHPCGSPVILPAPTWVRIGEHHSYKRLSPGPRLGKHSKEILQELGYEESEIAELIRLKIAHEYMTELGGKDAYFF